MKKIRKALIPAAGLGTRFLPITQSIPKEMLPLVDRPILLYIIEEAIEAGIEDIVIIQGRNKDEIIDFFDCNYELEDRLAKDGKIDLLDTVKHIRQSVNLISVRQQEALGLGHAVYTGKSVIGDDSFAVLLGDELMLGENRPTSQLVSTFDQFNLSCTSVMKVPEKEVNQYGIATVGESLSEDSFKISGLVEKPEAHEVDSRYALPGRYVFNSKVFDYLKDTKPGKNGEIQLTDAMIQLAKNEGLIGREIDCKRFDTGNKLGYLTAVIEVAKNHSEIGPAFRQYLESLKGER